MIVEVFCNQCKKKIKEVEKESFDYHHKDYCEGCQPTDSLYKGKLQ